MADTDVQTSMNDAADKAASATRRGADAAAGTAKKAADAVSDTAKAGIEAEQRTFDGAQDASRQSAAALGRAAQTSLKAGQEMARHGQDIARRASDQAADFWRSSMTPMSQMSGEMNRWFEQMWKGASPMGMGAGPLAMLGAFTNHPVADLRATDQGYELCVELPGLSATDVDLTIRGDALVLSGEKADDREQGQGAYRLSERRFGRFERVFPLPPGADRNAIDAAFDNGLLRVSIPMPAGGEAEQPVHIKG